MKKVVSIIATVLIAIFSMNLAAQSYDKDCEKVATKAAKNMAKQIKKEKWTYAGSMSLEDKLKQYYLKTGECGRYEDNAKVTSSAKTITTGENTATQAMVAELAQNLFQTVAGTSAADISSEEEEFAQSKIKSIYQGDLSACVERAITVYKQNRDGRYEVRVLFLIDKDRKEKLQNKASRELGDERWRQILKDVDDSHAKK